jgi:hypothetical protein
MSKRFCLLCGVDISSSKKVFDLCDKCYSCNPNTTLQDTSEPTKDLFEIIADATKPDIKSFDDIYRSKLSQIFKNKSDCYADTREKDEDGGYHEGEVIMTMTKEVFIDVVTKILKGEL